MRLRSRVLAAVWLLLVLVAFAKQVRPHLSELGRMERKLQHIERNGGLAHPDSRPTELTEGEVNAYFAAGKVAFPAGVQSVRFQAEPGIVTATTRVDFDQLHAGRSSLNPLLEIFNGVHETVVVAHAHGVDGTGNVHVDSVSLDGVDIPRFVLQLFVDKYLQPKYPGIGLDTKFALPDRISTAVVSSHTVMVTQK